MHRRENGLRNLTLVLALSTLGSLLVSSFGVVFETPLLVYFWWLALAGMAAMALLTLLLAVNWLSGRLLRQWYRLQLQWGDGLPGH